ncbi:MAG: hypothetical protein WDM70_02525 [Nitrosomonadales bacterium]
MSDFIACFFAGTLFSFTSANQINLVLILNNAWSRFQVCFPNWVALICPLSGGGYYD